MGEVFRPDWRKFKPGKAVSTTAADYLAFNCIATMDLRAWPVDSGWPMYSRFTGGKKDIGFASGTAEAPSIVNVNLAGRTDLIALKNSESPYIVTWSSQPANVDFVLDAQSRANGYRIYSEAEGLKLKRFTGFMILVK